MLKHFEGVLKHTTAAPKQLQGASGGTLEAARRAYGVLTCSTHASLVSESLTHIQLKL